MPGEIIRYVGGVEELTADLDRRRSVLERAYVRALGLGHAQKLADVAEKTLGRESFFDTIQDFVDFARSAMPQNRPNTFSISAFPLLDDTDERPLRQPITISAAPVLYISARGVNPLAAPRHPETILTSFVHNYNKFVWFAIQDPTMYLFVLGEHSMLETFVPYAIEVESGNLSQEEKMSKLNRAYLGSLVQEINNCATDLLDRVVLDEIGVRVDLEWRHKPRGVMQLGPFPSGMMVMLPYGGDPFFATDMSNSRIVRAFADEWHTFISPKGFAPDPVKDAYKVYAGSVVKNVSVKRVSITELRGASGQKSNHRQ